MQNALQITPETVGMAHESRPVYPMDSLMLGTDIRKPDDIQRHSYQDIIEIMQDGAMKNLIEAIRTEQDPEQKKKLKMQLPYFVTGVFKESRKNSNMLQMNAMVLDYDHLENPEYFKEHILPNLDFVQLAFTSPNRGLKLYIPFSVPIFEEADFKAVYRYYQGLADNLMKLQSDPTNDPARATFLSYDDNLYQNPQVNKVNPEIALQLAIAQEVKKAVKQHDYLDVGKTEEISEATMQDILSATEYCAKVKMSYHDWTRFGMAIKSALGDAGKGLWNLFLNNPHFPDEKQITLDRHWASFNRIGKVTYKTIFYIARRYGWKPPHKPVSPMAKLADYPELLELFGTPVNISLEVDKLPEFLQEYLKIVGEITDAQDGAKITALLPVIATNIGNRVYMYNAGTQHYCNIWAAVIGPSSVSRKTTVINLALKTIKQFQDSLSGMSAKERNEADITLTRVTQARLFNLLAKNPNRLVVQHEMAAWMQEMNKTYNAGMKQDLTNMFDGRDMSIAKMEIDEYICKPAFSIIGGTTEDWFFKELREVADQRGGFLQRFIICMIQNIDVNSLNFSFRDNTEQDRELYQMNEILSVFRDLEGNYRLNASDEAIQYRDDAYTERMRASAMTGSDPMASYCSRMYDNYWFRFCILIFMMNHWQTIRDIQNGESRHSKLDLESSSLEKPVIKGKSDNAKKDLDTSLRWYDSVADFFNQTEIDIKIAQQAMYLCDYYFENTKPFLASLAENAKLDGERKIIRILQKAPNYEMTHSRLLNKSKMTSKEFRFCIESLIERQAVLCHDWQAGNNRSASEYSLNPILIQAEL
jgi:hypothetical protein